MEKVVALVFAYNEENRLPTTLINLRQFKQQGLIHEIVVINDGSTDKTRDVCKKLGVKVISHKRNMGKRQAFITGVRESQRIGAQIILSFDSDIKLLPKETLSKMIDSVRKGKKLMSIASQYEGGSSEKLTLAQIKKNISTSTYTEVYATDFGDKRAVKNKSGRSAAYDRITLLSSSAQRAINMSALSPLLRNNKKWMLYFRSGRTPPKRFVSEVFSKVEVENSKKWGLEKALDLLIPSSKTVILSDPVFTDKFYLKTGAYEPQNISKRRLDYLKELRRKKAEKLKKSRIFRHKK